MERCIKESPEAFKINLLLKINVFIQEDSKIYLGLRSHQYLNAELQAIDPTLFIKKTDPLKLASDLKSKRFILPSINRFNSSELSRIPHQSTSFREGGTIQHGWNQQNCIQASAKIG